MPWVKPLKSEDSCKLADSVDAVKLLANATANIADILGVYPDEGYDHNSPVGTGTVAYAINRVADAIFTQVESQDGLHRIAEAINNLAAAVREKS